VFAALGIQFAMRTHITVICDLTGSTIFFYINSTIARVLKKKLLNTICVLWFSYNFGLKHFSLQDLSELWLKMYIGLHVK